MTKTRVALILALALAASVLALAGDHPWKDAKVGDWVKYESVAMGATSQMKWTVTAKTETSITYDIETTVAGQTFKTTQILDLTTTRGAGGVNVPKDAPKPTITEDTVTVAGKSWKCKKVEMTLANGMKSTSWTTTELHLGGLVKSETSGTVSSTMTLVDWGPK
jgi:hypothetical protein